MVLRDITDAVSLEATARSRVNYAITAPFGGRLQIEERPASLASVAPSSAAPVEQVGAFWVGTDRAGFGLRAISGGPRSAGVGDESEPDPQDEVSSDVDEGNGDSDDPESGAQPSPADDKGSHLDPKRYLFWFVDLSGGYTELSVPLTATQVVAVVPPDTEVLPNTPILEIVDAAVLLEGPVSATQALKVGDRTPQRVRAQVHGSSGPFECAATDPRLALVEDQLRFSCRPPLDTPLVVGATARIVLILEVREGVPALPIEAVAGSIASGFVYRAQDLKEQIPVTLGVSDGAYVEIRSGVAVGDSVAIPSPSILEGERDGAR